MRLSIYIAKRYLFARKSRNAINIISAVSVAGVTVGTMALIIILSVFNGLEEMVSSIFNTFDPELKVTAAEGKVFPADTLLLRKISALPGVKTYSLTLEENALFIYEEKEYIGTVKGVDDNYSSVSGIDSSIYDGSFSLFSNSGTPLAVVGAGIANNLGININFIAQLQIWVPSRTASVNLDPENSFIKKYLSPSGIFRVEQEYDSKYVFVPLDFARMLFEYNNEASSIEIITEGVADPDMVRNNLEKLLGDKFTIKNRFEQREIFYKVMRSERLAIFIILSLIILIASFNIIGSLTMLIIEKERDIEILKSLGAWNGLIRRIFIFEGWLISIIGAFAGIVLGLLICFLQIRFGLIKLSGETLILDAYPVVLKARDFLLVPATVLLIGFWAAWYPVRYLTKKYLNPETRT